MDLLIKNNIMKRNKIIVDVGTHTTKILDVHYASKEIYVKEAKDYVERIEEMLHRKDIILDWLNL